MDRVIEKKMWTKKRIVLLSSAALFVLFALYTFVLSDTSSKLNVETERLTISEVKRAPFQEYIPVTGTVEPIQTFFLDLSDGGKVVGKYLEEGAMLNIGTPIIKLDNPNLSLQVLSTQSNFVQAQSISRQTRLGYEQNIITRRNQMLDLNLNLLIQERTYKNNKVLYEKGMISKNEFDESREKYETMLKSLELVKESLKKDSLTYIQLVRQGESDVEMSKNYLTLVQNQLANLTVSAPIKGQLTSLNCEIGQSVGAGYRLGQIDNIDSFKVRTEIDEHYISRITEGQTGEYEFDSKIYTLKIKTVYPQVTNGRFYVDMIFTGKQPKGIRRGQTMHIKLQLGGLSDALLIESGGFFSTTGGQWIFVVDKSGTFAVRKQIKIGRQNPQYYEVLEGLKAGEKVITSSYDNYNEYDKLVLQ
ncbi:MAG: HlyD family efflux transporter periplasmic adaptor subunit [Ignavibacteriales bacterium]|nr:HlyD family efflux transporter periplasmic adaptor subunit [Ignavibacteriales bacterium]